MSKTIVKMIEEFQCPGCVGGMDTTCGSYKLNPRGTGCDSHVPGTSMGLGNPISLGLPKGFNKTGVTHDGVTALRPNIRLWPSGKMELGWDHLNVPVWAMEKDGSLFVRTFCPRINKSYVDVVDQGTLSMVQNAINVSEFIDEID